MENRRAAAEGVVGDNSSSLHHTCSRNDAGGAYASDLPWYRRLWVGMEVGPSGVNQTDPSFYSRASEQAIVDGLLKANVDLRRNLMKDQDFAITTRAWRAGAGTRWPRSLGEITDAARHSLPIVACCRIQYDTAAWWAHYPDWRMETGFNPAALARASATTPVILTTRRKIAAELMKYDIVGFHDMLDFGFSHLRMQLLPETNCQPRFAIYKMEMPRPAKPTWDADWDKILEFRANSNTRFCHELQSFVHATRPGVAVDYNYHGYPPFSWVVGELPVRHAINGDFVTAESLPWIFGYNNPSLLASLFWRELRINWSRRWPPRGRYYARVL